MKKILFVSHDATLTGAPKLLLNLINLIREKQLFEIKIVVKNGFGELLDEFLMATPKTLIWNYPVPKTFINRILNKIYPSRSNYQYSKNKMQKEIDESPIIFLNTITNGDFLKNFKFNSNHRIITYVHELEASANLFINIEDFKYVKELTQIWLVPCLAVKSFLVNEHLIDENRIHVLNYYIPSEDDLSINNLSLSHTQQQMLVGLAGTLNWRKGADLLPLILFSYYKKFPSSSLKFIWRGANMNSLEYKRIYYELQKLNLQHKIDFQGASKDMSSFYQNIFMFLLISKEDPYPLVVLEAAKFGLPCICFKDSGGSQEFVGQNNGDVVQFLDIDLLTDKIHQYYSNPLETKTKGNNALGHFKNLHGNSDLIIQQFTSIIDY